MTDANLMLGRLDAGSQSAGTMQLDVEAAEAAVERLARELEIEPLEAAEGIARVANQEMVRALRVVTVERGVDPRDYALLPFGGAGPMHAAAIAEELGIEQSSARAPAACSRRSACWRPSVAATPPER